MPLNPRSCGDCGLCNCLMARICQGELLVVVVMVCQIRGMRVKVLLGGNYGNAKDNDNNMLWCSHNNTITPPCAIIIITSLQSEVNTASKCHHRRRHDKERYMSHHLLTGDHAVEGDVTEEERMRTQIQYKYNHYYPSSSIPSAHLFPLLLVLIAMIIEHATCRRRM